MKKEKVLLFTRDNDIVKAITQGATELDLEECVLSPNSSDLFSTNFLSQKLGQVNLSLIFIDSKLDMEDLSTKELAKLKLFDLRKVLQDPSQAPVSLKLLHSLEQIRKSKDLQGLLIFYFIDAPGIALTQEILRFGADWVWTHRFQITELDLVIKKIRLLSQQPFEPPKPSVLVVEDSPNACELIQAKLEDICELDFVLDSVAEEKPQNSLAIETDDVIRVFDKARHRAVVVDLVLNPRWETEAERLFQRGEEMIQSVFTQTKGDEGRQATLHVFEGLRVIKKIREISPTVLIFVLSNYVGNEVALNLIYTYLGPEISRQSRPITVLYKTDDGFTELRKLIEGELLSSIS